MPPPVTLAAAQPNNSSFADSMLAKILERLKILETRITPSPVEPQVRHNRQTNAATATRAGLDPRGGKGSSSDPVQLMDAEDDNFTPVTHKGRSRKGRNIQPSQTNCTPTSYAGAATAAANTKQPPAPPKQPARLPTITEVTILRSGGHPNPQVERELQTRAADAIVREVRLKMAKAVAKPVPLRAGRWSVHPRSKGNFVFSFDGNVPFDLIMTYEHILLAPFYGTGQLSPSMGWTRLLAHGVPVLNDAWEPFTPDALLKEVKEIPGLKKAHFAMTPRWLKPAEQIRTNYSTVTFAISDPDGTISSAILNGRAALFGKEVTIQRWVEKPALVQCSHCHALGHIKTSRACPLGKDSDKCYRCGGSHKSEEHDKKCPRKHTIAGLCDCTHYKCLSCHNAGHNCRDKRCPARDLYRPRSSRRPRKPRDRGKDRELDPGEGPSAPPPPPNLPLDEPPDLDGDLYEPAPAPLSPTSRQARTARHHRSIEALINRPDHLMDIDNSDPRKHSETTYDTEEFPEAWNSTGNGNARPTGYSPSCPQSGAANLPVD